jgi:small ligand-binding sensory domain FIST
VSFRGVVEGVAAFGSRKHNEHKTGGAVICAGTGLSTDEDSGRAAAAAAGAALARAGIDRAAGARADLALVFATPPHRAAYARIARTVREATGATCLVGASGLGVLTGEQEVEGSAAVGVLVLAGDGLAAMPVFARGLAGRSAEVARQIARAVRPAAGAASALVLFLDPYGFEAAPFLDVLGQELPGLPVVGGAAAEAPDHPRTYQMCGDLVDAGAVAGVLLGGGLRAVVGVTQACQPIGEPRVITRAAGNLIFELDGRPAVSVLAELMPEPLRGRLDRAAGLIFAGLPVEREQSSLAPGEYVVRNIVGADPAHGALAVAGPVATGSIMTFTLREPFRAREDLRRMLADVARRAAGLVPRAALYVNCCARGRNLYGVADIDTAFIEQRFPGLPVLGFASAAELGPVMGRTALLQYSGVLTLLCDHALGSLSRSRDAA